MRKRFIQVLAILIGIGAGLLILVWSSVVWKQISITTGSGERFEFGLVISLSAVGGAILCGVLAFHVLKAIWPRRGR